MHRGSASKPACSATKPDLSDPAAEPRRCPRSKRAVFSTSRRALRTPRADAPYRRGPGSDLPAGPPLCGDIRQGAILRLVSGRGNNGQVLTPRLATGRALHVASDGPPSRGSHAQTRAPRACPVPLHDPLRYRPGMNSTASGLPLQCWHRSRSEAAADRTRGTTATRPKRACWAEPRRRHQASMRKRGYEWSGRWGSLWIDGLWRPRPRR
jgi:hypothetical protein